MLFVEVVGIVEYLIIALHELDLIAGLLNIFAKVSCQPSEVVFVKKFFQREMCLLVKVLCVHCC